jgi:hypothetical protein
MLDPAGKNLTAMRMPCCKTSDQRLRDCCPTPMCSNQRGLRATTMWDTRSLRGGTKIKVSSREGVTHAAIEFTGISPSTHFLSFRLVLYAEGERSFDFRRKQQDTVAVTLSCVSPRCKHYCSTVKARDKAGHLDLSCINFC